METLTKNICDIVIAETNIINSKIKGLNFLELLKNNIINKLLSLIKEEKLPFDQIINFEKKIEENIRNINISINYYLSPLSVTKKIIENDSLFISLTEASNFDIYKDDKNFKSILIYKNTGITLPKDTVINFKLSKNALLLEIKSKDTEQILTN